MRPDSIAQQPWRSTPLKFTDSTGLEIEILGNTGGRIAGGWALGQMLDNPILGNMTALAMMDSLNKVVIEVVDGSGLEEYGGGRTWPPSKRSNGGLICQTRQSMDAHYAWAANPKWHKGLPLAPGLPLLNWTSMISHEFGHGLAYIYGLPNKPASLFFENAIRQSQGSPPRPSHEWPTAPFWGPAR